jgi:N-acetylglucosaminyl-diphospho-decaprenol L-rhamnosyltransferase
VPQTPAANAPILSIGIVNWNTCDDLRACLLSLREHPYTQGEQEIIVVDNGSTDHSSEMVRTEFPEVNLIASPTNTAFAQGTNESLAAATGDILLLLNPDTEVSTGALDILVETLQADPKRGAVAAKLIYPDDQGGGTQPSVRGFPDPVSILWDILKLYRLFPGSRRFGAYRQTHFDYEAQGPAPQPMASCLLVSRHCWETVGPMDERFPLFFNDADWSLRCHNAGFLTWYEPRAVVVHKGGGTTKKVRGAAVWESHRALLRIWGKHYKTTTPRWLYALMTALVTLGAWQRTKRWGEKLGRDGGETTPESLHRELERARGPARLPAQSENGS